MNDDRVGLAIDGEGEELSRSRNRGDDLLNLWTSLDLEAIGTVISCALGLEQFVELGHQLQEIHKPDISAADIEGK